MTNLVFIDFNDVSGTFKTESILSCAVTSGYCK